VLLVAKAHIRALNVNAVLDALLALLDVGLGAKGDEEADIAIGGKREEVLEAVNDALDELRDVCLLELV
jgi:hypothetical protein